MFIIHDPSEVTANYLSELVTYLRNRGYVLVDFDLNPKRVNPYIERGKYDIQGYGWGDGVISQ